ncbi:MAG: hypothetical protein ACYC7A_12390 [Thermoanaerobaculia bacterium]
MFSPRFRFLPLLIALAAMMIVTAAPAVAGSTMLTPASERVSRLSVADREGVRLEIEAYLIELEASTAAFYALPAEKEFAARAGIDPVGDIRMARAMIPHLTYREIDALRDFYLSNPVSLQVPEHIQRLVDRSLDKPVDGRFSGMAVDGNSCSPGPGTPLGITDFYIADAVALALEVTMECLPTDVITVAGHAVAAIAWGIAKGVAMTLEGLNAVEAECLGAQEEVAQGNFRTTVTTFLNNETNYVSDNELDLGVTTITNNDNSNRTMIIDNDNTNRDLMVAEMRKIGCDVIRLLNTPEGQRQSSLSSCSGQPAFPYNFPEKSMQVTGAFTSTAIDLEAVDQPVRRPFASTVSLEIHLLEGRLLPTYYLPVARGGMLEEVKALVWSTLDAQRELGIAVGQLATAESFARAADDLLSQKSYVDAYRSYAKAYQQLLPQ